MIEEGLKARTTNIDDIKEPKGNRNGAVFFPQCVYSHDPLDYIIIFLGTNDMKSKFNSNAKTCANNIEEKYIKVLKDKIFQDLIQIPQIIIVAPSIIKEGLFDGFEGAENKSKSFNTINSPKVGRYDTKGNLLETFENLTACRKAGYTNANKVLEGLRNHCKGYVFKYLD